MSNLMKRRGRLSPMMELQQEINQLFNSDWVDNGAEGSSLMASDWVPAIDIKEEKDHYLIKADVPGVKPEDIDVDFHDNVLTLKGEKESEHKEKTDEFTRVERSKGTFMRRFSLPNTIDSDSIKAKCTHGVLEVIVPKSSPASSKKISVES